MEDVKTEAAQNASGIRMLLTATVQDWDVYSDPKCNEPLPTHRRKKYKVDVWQGDGNLRIDLGDKDEKFGAQLSIFVMVRNGLPYVEVCPDAYCETPSVGIYATTKGLYAISLQDSEAITSPADDLCRLLSDIGNEGVKNAKSGLFYPNES